MFRIRSWALLLAVVLAAPLLEGLVAGGAAHAQKLYTAYNMWYEHPRKMYVLNYKKGTLIPAGTEITDLEVNRKSYEFKIGETNYRIIFTRKWHPGLKTADYKDRVFTTKNFAQLSAGITGQKLEAVKRGAVMVGMTRAEVLLTWGYPPEHRTPSLEANKWLYWRNRWVTAAVCFNKKGLTVASCSEIGEITGN